MKTYFAGSIRGGRDDKEIYHQLIQHLSSYGDVLTEHVGALDLSDFGEKGKTDEFIYTRDMDWIKEADVLVADVSTTSLGVGYEIGQAESMNKQILCLYRNQKGKRLSAMLDGNKNLTISKYDSLEEAKKHIDTFFESLKISLS